MNATGDIANVLEKHNTKYYLQLQDNILVRVNSIGELSYEKLGNEIREEIPKKGPAHLKDKISINYSIRKGTGENKRDWTYSCTQNCSVQERTWTVY